MAKTLSKSGIATGQDILAKHVTQSIDALTGIDDYDITISGSIVISGSTFLSPTNSSIGTSILTTNTSGKVFKTGSLPLSFIPTLQTVTDQGASTTNDLTITGNITGSDLVITASNFAVIAKGTGDDVISLIAGADGDIFIQGEDHINLNNRSIRITGSHTGVSIFGDITSSADISASGNLIGNDLILDYDSLPSSDPSVKGQVYRNGSNQLFISAG